MSSRRDDTRAPSVRLIEAVRSGITSGALAPGAKIPSVKDLATEYGIATATAQNALRVLQGEGLIYAVQGRGNFVSADAQRLVAKREPEPSASEYRTILDQLDRMSATLDAFDARLTGLEQAVHPRGPEGAAGS